MAPRRLQLEGASLEELTDRVFAEHGSAARIVSAEKVTTGGIRGFFAKQHFEVIVELPDPGRRSAHRQLDTSARLGIAALLDDADAAEAQLHGDAPPAAVSTGSPDFARLMDDLTFTVAPEPAAPAFPGSAEAGLPGLGELAARAAATPALVAPSRPAPALSRRAGDLVLVVGASQDAYTVARSMAAAAGSPQVFVGGSLLGADRVEDRRTANAARARGVQGQHSVFVAFGLGRGGREAHEHAAALTAVGADQVWVAVDPGRKPEDTAAWVGVVRAAVPVDGIALEGAEGTASPNTVDGLGLPIGWRDGRPVG
ncbi:hypothetical protein [Diaminobutyricimonas sp. LJ205]|uniref:hypothetical protein n=1 Tax=Diaminobutyricimonas sp. LJ205 TaxID=2683590 RepID=UPI0012F4A3AA|nr:hypothetical protein [Diaminobutyricimonas sp. LJ205]